MKVVMHVHSTWSYDGKWSLPSIARLYDRLGVDAVMMTEHDTGFDPVSYEAYRTACAAASTNRCRLIPGIEYSSESNDVHILTWGVPRFLGEHRAVSATLDDVAEAGGAAIFAHPIRREAFRLFDHAWVDRLSGIEVWNRKSDGVVWGEEARKLIAATGLPDTVGQDFHKARHLWPLTMRFQRPDGDLEAGLVSALRQGQFEARAFGRPIRDGQGELKRQPHAALEGCRRGLRDLVRGRKSKRVSPSDS